MKTSIYNALNSSSHRAARAFLVATLAAPPQKGNWNGWSIDTGRLEDGIAETLQAYFKSSNDVTSGSIGTEFAPSEIGCSHGIAGIFGSQFAARLESSGRTLMIHIDYTVSGNRVTFTDYRFELV